MEAPEAAATPATASQEIWERKGWNDFDGSGFLTLEEIDEEACDGFVILTFSVVIELEAFLYTCTYLVWKYLVIRTFPDDE